jgi:hypothetical protein
VAAAAADGDGVLPSRCWLLVCAAVLQLMVQGEHRKMSCDAFVFCLDGIDRIITVPEPDCGVPKLEHRTENSVDNLFEEANNRID